MRERYQRNVEPGAEGYGSPSIVHAPVGAMNSFSSPLSNSKACPPTPAPRCGNSYGQTCSLKSTLGSSSGPASSITTCSPPSVRIFAAVPPAAPDPTMHTSYTLGERLTCAMHTLPHVWYERKAAIIAHQPGALFEAALNP